MKLNKKIDLKYSKTRVAKWRDYLISVNVNGPYLQIWNVDFSCVFEMTFNDYNSMENISVILYACKLSVNCFRSSFLFSIYTLLNDY